jgi:hypothetical protein
MTAAALPFAYFNPVIPEKKIYFPVQRHRRGQISEKILETHFVGI